MSSIGGTYARLVKTYIESEDSPSQPMPMLHAVLSLLFGLHQPYDSCRLIHGDIILSMYTQKLFDSFVGGDPKKCLYARKEFAIIMQYGDFKTYSAMLKQELDRVMPQDLMNRSMQKDDTIETFPLSTDG